MAHERLASRAQELRSLQNCLNSLQSDIVFVHGMKGVGKTTLLTEFARHCPGPCLVIDCHKELHSHNTTETLKTKLAALLRQTTLQSVLIVDHIDCTPELEPWIRQATYQAALPPGKLIIAGRSRPDMGWMTAKPCNHHFHSLTLQPLTSRNAHHYITSLNVSQPIAGHLEQLAHGHPAVLNILCANASVFNPENPAYADCFELIHLLINYFFPKQEDITVLKNLEPFTFVSHMSEPGLAYISENKLGPCDYHQLSRHWAIEHHHEGLSLSPVITQLVNSHLQARDPHRYRRLQYRTRLWMKQNRSSPLTWFIPAQRQLQLAGNKVDLTPLENGVLNVLMTYQGNVVSRKALLEQVWEIHYEGASNVVDTIIVSLRRKLAAQSNMIETVRGVGYRLNIDSDLTEN